MIVVYLLYPNNVNKSSTREDFSLKLVHVAVVGESDGGKDRTASLQRAVVIVEHTEPVMSEANIANRINMKV